MAGEVERYDPSHPPMLSPAYVFRIPLKNQNIEIQDLQDPTMKQKLRIQDPQDPTTEQTFKIQGLQDLKTK